jgi:hypothetical protein
MYFRYELCGRYPSYTTSQFCGTVMKHQWQQATYLCALTEHHAMEAYWGSGGIAPLILWPWHEMEVSGRRHAPAALPLGKEPLLPIG